MSRLSLDMTTVRIPTATYRLQFNKNFTFQQAREIVTYLQGLGISDAYASPYFQAGAESLHGYDITDHNKFNAAIGSREDYDAWVAELHAHGMGQIADFVPNHMGINDPQNVWWQDVLENGPSSLYAPYFDIDWRPLKSDLHDKVLLPILGDQYGRVLERGELRVCFDGGSFSLTYFDHVFPIAPGTYRYILELALENLAEFREEDFYAEFQSILTALEYLPRRTETDPERIKERAREKEIIKKRLERRCAEAPQVQRAIEKAVETINGHIGDPRSFDRLDELLNAQSYRLAFWQVAAEEINYRRFFDVNDLAAIRVELPEVFDAAHKLLFELVASGAVTGLRIDHPDGLYRPLEYFEKLQLRCAKALRVPLPKDGRAIYLIVEKILTGEEQLPQNWPVHGTTGYDFANQVAGVLVDHNAEGAITKIFKRFIGHSLHFGHLVYAKKRLVMRISLANEVNVLGNMVDRLSEQNRWFRDYTLEALARAVRETIACFPVYRTYLEPGKPLSEEMFHQRNLRRQRDWPASLLATSTHDSKRSEDVRARVLAISEIPHLWGRSLQKWRTANRRFKKQVDEAEAPDAGEEYLLYQTLLGTWPVDLDGAPVSSVGQEFVTRIQRYMAKALKEAKLNTSWIQPNENWDAAMQEFVARILEAGPRNKFLPAFLPVAAEVARLGTINSLAQTAIKLTAPGLPDIYQGTEIWDDSLVDPDNRRPIDYVRRCEMLTQIEKLPANELMQCWPDGRIKMRLTQRLLHLRRENPELFREGIYEPINFGGAFADCAIGFVRRDRDRAIIVIVPRLSSRVGFPPIGDRWQDTHVVLPAGISNLRDVFSDGKVRVENSQLRLAVAMSQLPFAVLQS